MAPVTAPQTVTFQGKHYTKGTPLPDDVAEGLGLTKSTTPGPAPAPSLEDEVRALIQRRAAEGHPEAVEALASFSRQHEPDDEPSGDEVTGDGSGTPLPPASQEERSAPAQGGTPPAASGPFTLGEPSGTWFPVLDGSGAQVDKVKGEANAQAAVDALNAGTADGTAA